MEFIWPDIREPYFADLRIQVLAFFVKY